MVPRCRGGGALVGGGGGRLCKSIRILASISMGGPNLKSWVASLIPGRSHIFAAIELFLQSFSFSPMIHSIRAVVICAQSTNRFFKLAQEKRSALGRAFYYSSEE